MKRCSTLHILREIKNYSGIPVFKLLDIEEYTTSVVGYNLGTTVLQPSFWDIDSNLSIV